MVLFLFILEGHWCCLLKNFKAVFKVNKMDRKTMKTVDMPKEFTSFTPSEQHYIKKFEELNAGRAGDMKLLRTRNKRGALLMGGIVMGICILSSEYSLREWHGISYGIGRYVCTV